jgi:hypothetical protein
MQYNSWVAKSGLLLFLLPLQLPLVVDEYPYMTSSPLLHGPTTALGRLGECHLALGRVELASIHGMSRRRVEQRPRKTQ